jgi:hypothetical protein
MADLRQRVWRAWSEATDANFNIIPNVEGR